MFTARDHKLFDVAKSVARTSRHPKAHVGAVLVSGKDVVSVGVNGKKSHPLQQKFNNIRFKDDSAAQHLMHAEIEALVKGRAHHREIEDAAIYVYRVMKDGSIGMARPCVGCMAALKEYGIREVFYTTDQGLAYERVDLAA